MSATWLPFFDRRDGFSNRVDVWPLPLNPPRTGQDIQLLPSLRYAHSEAYIRRLADEAGFTSVRISEAPIRHDQTTPIMGLYVYLE